MVLAFSDVVDHSRSAPSFNLFGADGVYHQLADLKGKCGTLVMFICNHCPYVISILDRLCAECKDMKQLGIESIAIMPNDVIRYPQDSFFNMVKLSEQKRMPFTYLIDDIGKTAAEYGAKCTPDFFGFNSDMLLQYRGRFDDSGDSAKTNFEDSSDLYKAMVMIASSGKGPSSQEPSKGCSIKW